MVEVYPRGSQMATRQENLMQETTSMSVEISQESRERVAGELQPLLFDLIDLALQGKQSHWNVTGPLLQPVHTQLDLVVNNARLWADDVAERLVTIGIPASGQARGVTEGSSLEPLPTGSISDRQAVAMITERVASVAGRARGTAERLADLDLASQDLVIEVVRGLEKHLWMLCAQLS
jgi:starvation-inducible DNA-binding protein